MPKELLGWQNVVMIQNSELPLNDVGLLIIWEHAKRKYLPRHELPHLRYRFTILGDFINESVAIPRALSLMFHLVKLYLRQLFWFDDSLGLRRGGLLFG